MAYWVYRKSTTKQSFFAYLFPRKTWLSQSAWVDISILFFNSFIKIVCIAPFFILGFQLAHYVHECLFALFGNTSFRLGKIQTLFWYTISITVVGDLLSYIVHYLFHRIPFLWHFHKVHHSASTLNFLTQYRIHPVELMTNNIKSLCVFGVLTGLFDYLSDYQVEKILFLGVNVFTFIFMFLGANLRHSHVRFSYPRVLEKIFISPFQHQIHHSDHPKHFNKNLGSKLAIWDWLFGTLVLSSDTKEINYGIGVENRKYDSFIKNMCTPFVHVYKSIYAKLFQ